MITTRYTLKLHRKNPSGGERCWNLALLADVHNASFGKDHAMLVDALKTEGVCAVLSCGDLVTVRGGPALTDQAFRLIQVLAEHWPLYLSNGNHEMRLKEWTRNYPGLYQTYQNLVLEAGGTLLHNRRAEFVLPGSTRHIGITGYSLPLSKYDRLRPGQLSLEEMRGDLGDLCRKPGTYEILLAHHPDYVKTYARWGCDLVLSGHLHGGMIRLPLVGGVIGGGLKPFPRYDKGMFSEGKTRMIVSAGLGSHTMKLRPLNPTELVILQLQE